MLAKVLGPEKAATWHDPGICPSCQAFDLDLSLQSFEQELRRIENSYRHSKFFLLALRSEGEEEKMENHDTKRQMTILSGVGSFLLMFVGGLMLLLTRIGIDSNGYLVISPTFALGLTLFGFAILLAIFGKRS